MRTRKIRGHKRTWTDIQNWKNANLNLDIENLKNRERDYAKIWVAPFSNISMTNSIIPQPKRETKKRILSGLIEIYESWENELRELNQPYYLKIWLFEQRFSKSQVVCAIGDSIEYYDNIFNSPQENKIFKSNDYGKLKNQLDDFNWNHKLDEDVIDDTFVGEIDDYASENEFIEAKKWFDKELKKPHTKSDVKYSNGDIMTLYSFKKGEVWVGQK